MPPTLVSWFLILGNHGLVKSLESGRLIQILALAVGDLGLVGLPLLWRS